MIRNDDRLGGLELSIREDDGSWHDLLGPSPSLDPSFQAPPRPVTSEPPSHPVMSQPPLRSLTTPPPKATPDQLLQGARACLRRGRTRDAATLMALACEVAPLDVRCRATLAWLRVQCGEARPAVAGEQLVELLTRAVRLYPEDLELRMYRAAALQRLGRRAEALIDFSFVAEADPRNAVAAAEMRLHHQREHLTGSGVFALDRHERAVAPSIAPRSPSARPRQRRR